MPDEIVGKKNFPCQVPLFHGMDDLILDNICDRLRPLVFSSGEKVIREGDPVQRMVFILQGKLRSTQPLTKGVVATCVLGAGNFLGDELLSWCLRRPFVDRLPASSATFECVEAAQAFCLDAPDLRFITEHFRYKFANEKLKHTARYYSSNWRTWAAVNIQLAWRRYRARKVDATAMAAPPSLAAGPDDGDRRLRHYAAMFMSLRPHDHLE
jgi:cyclic nucleotide gated channel